jgi:hypothetical protein
MIERIEDGICIHGARWNWSQSGQDYVVVAMPWETDSSQRADRRLCDCNPLSPDFQTRQRRPAMTDFPHLEMFPHTCRQCGRLFNTFAKEESASGLCFTCLVVKRAKYGKEGD